MEKSGGQPNPRFDRHEFAQFFDRFYDRIFNFIYFRVDDPQLADDLTAVTFERALQNFHQLDPSKGSEGSWLFAIARNLLTDHWRRTRRFSWLPLDRYLRTLTAGRDPEAQWVASEQEQELLSALKQLTDREQEILSLRFFGQLSNQEIARTAGLSENHIAVIIYRALKKLRNLLVEGTP
jgi:RNA polymerase sigma-70 factor (ECF subfamily)